jgi:hypothetical protein
LPESNSNKGAAVRIIFQVCLILSLSIPSALAAGGEEAAHRSKIRAWVMSHARPGLTTIEPQPNDLASDLVDTLKYSNLGAMEEAGLLKAKLETLPWAGFYWPTYAGQIANRYGDPSYNAATVWKLNSDYLERVIGQGDDKLLSPAEKYDILVGDANFTLTKKMIRAGASVADSEGRVPTWFGICHGWAPAAFMAPRPSFGVTAQAASGRDLFFTPSDLKALVSLLWANGSFETRFIGGRCNESGPQRDSAHRETNPDCFDTNPAAWHLSVVNQIGVGKRSFVLDASAGAEVWNQPVVGYQYGYINPLTGASSWKLAEAKVKRSEFPGDIFAAHRSPRAVYIVKVIMSLEYVTENSPSLDTEDRAERDPHYVQNYLYDLELDGDGNIVGGEWHTSVHPDFLWLPARGTSVSTVGDSWLVRSGDGATWDGHSPMAASWMAAAKISSRSEQPLARVVSRLFEMAQERR